MAASDILIGALIVIVIYMLFQESIKNYMKHEKAPPPRPWRPWRPLRPAVVTDRAPNRLRSRASLAKSLCGKRPTPIRK